MNTFLPYPSFADSARVLDDKRLRSQIDEANQILDALLNLATGWRNHPAAVMWRGSETYLLQYGMACVQQLRERGQDRLSGYELEAVQEYPNTFGMPRDCVRPPWLGVDCFHRSHQSNLLRKNPKHYGRFFCDVPDDLPYVWPRGAKC